MFCEAVETQLNLTNFGYIDELIEAESSGFKFTLDKWMHWTELESFLRGGFYLTNTQKAATFF